MTLKPMKHNSALLRETYWETTHACGLRVLVFPKRMTSTYAILSTAFGSVDLTFRKPGDPDWTTVPAGTAHYLEHKLFDDPDGTDAFARFSALGADANAYTDYTKTAYLFSTSEHFDESLSELLRFVYTPYFTPASVAKEQGIIAEEIRMGLDSPSDRCMQNLLEGLYSVNPVRYDICGTERSIAGITADLLYQCYRTFYQPSNMVLCVCGDVTPERVMETVDRVMPAPSAPVEPIRAPIREPDNPRVSYVEAVMPVAKPLFYLATKDPVLPADPSARLRRDAAISILSEVLFSRSSAFYSDLFEQGLLTPSYSHGYSGTDRFAFHSVCGESDDPAAVRDRFFAAIDRARRDGIPEADFLRARRCLIADQLRAYDSTEEICLNLLSFALEGVDLFDYPTLLSSVTPNECSALLETVFRPDRVCLSVVRPESETDTREKD